MAKLHRTISKIHPHALIDKDSFDEMHPMGTQAVMAEDARKAAEKAAEEIEDRPAIPQPKEEDVERIVRRRNARRARAAREMTVLSTDQGFGG